jgi:Ca-activated chloride channel family protein
MNELADLFNLTQLQHFHFLRPYWLLTFVVLFVVLRFFGQRDDTLALWREVMSTKILNTLTVQGNTRHWISPHKLSLIISIPLCLVLMGPTWQQQPSPFSENNAALVIALDVSETMEQGDVQPTRLLRAKQKILQLLKTRGDTKTALVAFSGSAHIVMPISNDQQMIRHFLDSLSQKIMPVDGKLPQSVLPIAKQLLSASNVPGTLLIIGDGASSESSVQFANYFNIDGPLSHHQLIVWAIGKKASQVEASSNIIPMQYEQLSTLADQSHGRLVTMTIDDQDVSKVNQFIKHNLIIIEDESRPWLDSGYLLTFVIAFLFLFWFRKGWTLQW